MIGDLKPYPAMRDSRLPWLGQVPEHWTEKRAGFFFREIDLRSTTGREELLSVSHVTGVTPRSQKNVTMFLAESNIGHKKCRPGDLVINTMWAWMGALGVARQEGLVSPSYAVYRARRGHAFVPGYLDFLLRTMPYTCEYWCRSTGIRASRLRLYPEQFLRIPTICPPLEEQHLILRFLDHLERRIRRYIRAKQKLVTLLEEQVAARASEAMRHPACTTERLKSVAREQIRSIEREDAELYVALGLYNRGRGVFHKPPAVGAELGDSTFSWVQPGDLVISGQFAWEGAVSLASSAEDQTIVSHRYYLLRGIEDRSTTPYLWALLRTDFGAMLLDQHSRGAAGRNRPLNLRTLLKEPVPVPPYEMQLAVDELVEAIAPLRARAALALNLCREYRAKLVADVVTGKLDVREAAARLPDEVEEPEPLDEVEAEAEADDAEGDADAVPEEAEA